MTDNPTARHPIRVGGRIVPAGGTLDADALGDTRLARIIAKGRAAPAAGAESADANRAVTRSGRPALPAPPGPEPEGGA